MTLKLAETEVPLPTAAVQLYIPESSSIILAIVSDEVLSREDMEYRPPFNSTVLPTLHVMVEEILVIHSTVSVESTTISWSTGDNTIPGGAASGKINYEMFTIKIHVYKVLRVIWRINVVVVEPLVLDASRV